MSVILYHFCCKRDMPGIKSQGITKGMIVGEDLCQPGTMKEKWQRFYMKGWQWLTYDKNRNRQSWATRRTIWIDRLEYRWTVEISDKDVDQLYDRDRLVELVPQAAPLFDNWNGSENWVVHRGPISKYQLKVLEHWNGCNWEEVWRA